MCLTTLALAVTLGSVHHVPGDFNETNPGLGVEVPVSECTYAAAGVFVNSFEDTAAYVGAGVDYSLTSWLDVGLMGAAVHGYQEKLGGPKIAPAAGLTAGVGTERLNLKLLHVPAIVTGFQLRMSF